jgi:hypothetical protein
LQALLQRWDNTPQTPEETTDLTEATDEEIFSALDDELGVS